MKILFTKDKNRRFSFLRIEKKKLILTYVLQNLNLPFQTRVFANNEIQNLLQKNSSTKIRNRCILTNRARAIYKKFKISRVFFKKLALQGELVGVKKASW